MNSITQLAKRFLEATVDQWGTDEGAVNEILLEVHGLHAEAEFSQALGSQINWEQAREIGSSWGETNWVPKILQSELSGAQLLRAQDLFAKGREEYHASRTEYFLEGLSNPLDLSSTSAKLFMAGGTAFFFGLSLGCPPAAAVLGAGVFLTLGLGRLAKNGVELLTADSEAEVKDNLRDLGEASLATLLFAPFVPKAWTTLRTFGESAPKIPPPELRLIDGGGTPASPNPSTPGPGGNSAAYLIDPYFEGNAALRLAAEGRLDIGPMAKLELLPPQEPFSVMEVSVKQLLFPLTVPVLPLPGLLEDGNPFVPGVTDPERLRQEGQVQRRLHQLQHVRQRMEDILGYSLLFPEMDREIQSLQAQLQASSRQAGQGGLSAVASAGETAANGATEPGENESLVFYLPRLPLALPNRLVDRDPRQRRASAEDLGVLGDPEAVPALLSQLAVETDFMARVEMIRALGKFKDVTTIEPLANFLDDPIPSVRWAALTAMLEANPIQALQVWALRKPQWSGDEALESYFESHPAISSHPGIFDPILLILVNENRTPLALRMLTQGSPFRLRKQVQLKGEAYYQEIIEKHPEILKEHPNQEIWIFTWDGDYAVGNGPKGRDPLVQSLMKKFQLSEEEFEGLLIHIYRRTVGDLPANETHW